MSSITGTTDTNISSWHAHRYSRIVQQPATLVDFRASLEWSGANGDLELDIWKVSVQTDTGSTLTNRTLSHIGQIALSDPSDTTYMKSATVCASLDATAKVFAENEAFMFTVRRTNGTDGVQYYINAAFTFELH